MPNPWMFQETLEHLSRRQALTKLGEVGSYRRGEVLAVDVALPGEALERSHAVRVLHPQELSDLPRAVVRKQSRPNAKRVEWVGWMGDFFVFHQTNEISGIYSKSTFAVCKKTLRKLSSNFKVNDKTK
jgi:hypothetical protein